MITKPYYFGYWLYSIHEWEKKLKRYVCLEEIFDNNLHKSNNTTTGGMFYGIKLSNELVIFLKLKYDIFIREFENFYWLVPNDSLNETYENMLNDIIENLNHNDN